MDEAIVTTATLVVCVAAFRRWQHQSIAFATKCGSGPAAKHMTAEEKQDDTATAAPGRNETSSAS